MQGARRCSKRWLRAVTAVAVVAMLVPGQAVGAAKPSTSPQDVKGAHLSHVTQAEREAAADRMKLQSLAAPAGTSALNSVMALAAPSLVPSQGGVPDYFGSPNWAFSPPLRKFVDTLPGLGSANKNNLNQFIPVAVPDTTTYPGSDYYEIGLVQYQEQMHSDLPPTTLRGYVQLNDPANPASKDASGNVTAWPTPHYLGPFVMARKDRPVRVKFTNLLPKGADGDLFIPTDTTVMGAGMGPLGMDAMPMNYTQNRGTLHLHGGISPWISDGTPHQWITPAGENTPYPKGVSVKNVPDMPDPGDGSMTFFYTNQQSARLMFYHDHSYGITRLNVYAGEAAGYMINDDTSDKLVSDGLVPADQIPLIIQDKSFVDTATVLKTDPTWNWGSGTADVNGIRPPVHGDLWYPHVYSPAQNPADASGMNAFGRWHYGPWFWPPTTNIANPPIPNPYYDPVNAQWENDTMPATPNPSMAGEAFMDTPIVNGTAFPTVDVDPKPYRLRVLNAASDRFWNLQMYEADSTTMSVDSRTNTEVKMVPAAATVGFPEGWPTDGREGGVPDPATAGPEWIQIGSEGGLLPKPAVIPQQPITWNMDPTTFNMGNVDLHSLLLGPAERADVVVDFSAYRGKTLILYNDAPAAFPARDPRLDYYTGAPDLTDTGGHSGPQVGFGPNTRTIMQIKVADVAPSQPFDIVPLNAAFASTATTAGAFAASQNPIIVPEARYNEAYNATFPVDPFVRIYQTAKTFLTIAGNSVSIDFKPKAIQDEMGEAFDFEYGRMSGKLGLELPGTNAGNQNFVLQNYIDPVTENVEVEAEPLAPVQADGTQIWKITHNGVDTHPIHWHLFDVQLINRVGWDNGVRPPDDNELGWKDTVRVSPLEDTIVALRPIKPKAPFGVPESIRPLDPTMPIGSPAGFSNIDPFTGQPLSPVTTNQLTNFLWEYVWHCHILSHEEMDMMRPMSANVPSTIPAAPVLTFTLSGGKPVLTWTDGTPVDAMTTWGNPANEIGFRVERAVVGTNGKPGTYAVIKNPLANVVTFTDTSAVAGTTYSYRVTAFNAKGQAVSAAVIVGSAATVPAAPTNLVTTLQAGPQVRLTWNDNASTETGFVVERSVGGGAFAPLATPGARTGTGSVTYTDTTVQPGNTYAYRVKAVNGAGSSGFTNVSTAVVPNLPTAPSGLSASAVVASPNRATVTLGWTDNSNNESSFTIQRATNAGFTTGVSNTTVAAGTVSATQSLPRNVTYWYRVRAVNAVGTSAWSNAATLTTP